ncbi:YgjV family protein, partial [Escherichia fergusonii]|nr:YgjV family protein [Escherichia fergusonii]
NAIRTLITLRTRSLWVMAIFIVLTGGFGRGEVSAPNGITTRSRYCHSVPGHYFALKGLTMRCVMWFSTCCWLTHNIWAGSIGGTMIEGSFRADERPEHYSFAGVCRRRGIDPFIVDEKQAKKKPLPP